MRRVTRVWGASTIGQSKKEKKKRNAGLAPLFPFLFFILTLRMTSSQRRCDETGGLDVMMRSVLDSFSLPVYLGAARSAAAAVGGTVHSVCAREREASLLTPPFLIHTHTHVHTHTPSSSRSEGSGAASRRRLVGAPTLAAFLCSHSIWSLQRCRTKEGIFF